MSFGLKKWKDEVNPLGPPSEPSEATPVDKAALNDMETRLSAYTDTEETRAKAAEGTVKGEVTTEKARAEAAENLKLAKANNLSDLASASTSRTTIAISTASSVPTISSLCLE